MSSSSSCLVNSSKSPLAQSAPHPASNRGSRGRAPASNRGSRRVTLLRIEGRLSRSATSRCFWRPPPAVTRHRAAATTGRRCSLETPAAQRSHHSVEIPPASRWSRSSRSMRAPWRSRRVLRGGGSSPP
jgi:hypothetical protein